MRTKNAIKTPTILSRSGLYPANSSW
jgi:hypothetical protein